MHFFIGRRILTDAVQYRKIFVAMGEKLTTLSISSRVAPAVDAIRGLEVATTLSNSGQSVNEQLAIFTKSRFCSSIIATEASSKGVDIARNPLSRISVTSRSKSALDKRVSENRLMYLTSSRPCIDGWMKVSRSRYCNLKAKLNSGIFLADPPNSRMTLIPWSISPIWLLAISSTNRLFGIR